MRQQTSPLLLHMSPTAPRVGGSAMMGLHHMQTRHLWSAVHLLHHPVALALRVVDVGEHVLNALPRAGKCPYSRGAFATPVCRHNGLHAKMCNTVGNECICKPAGLSCAASTHLFDLSIVVNMALRRSK
jgi:hypothetical protein